jgi:hypothetical protein
VSTLKVSSLFEVLEIPTNGGGRDVDGVGQLLDRSGPSLTDMLQN